MEEIWKDIQGYEGYYQVSNLGRVKSLSRVVHLFHGGTFVSQESIMKPYLHYKGYLQIRLLKNKITKRYQVHRLVALAFIPNDDEKRNQVNHIDGVKTNNLISNLEWCTGSENAQHSFDIGLQKPKSGESNGHAKKVAQYDMNGNFIKEYPYMSLASEETKTSICNMSSCCHGKRKNAGGYVWKFID